MTQNTKMQKMQMSVFVAKLKNCQMALLNLCMKFKKKLTKRLLLKHYESAISKKTRNMPQGSPNSGFIQKKVQKRGFSIKKTRGNWKIIFVLGSYESICGYRELLDGRLRGQIVTI